MRELKPPCNRSVFLCNRVRPPGAAKHSCGDHGADALRAWLKGELKAKGIWGKGVRVVPVDCLDVCPKQGVVLGFDGGQRLFLVDAENDRQAILDAIERRRFDVLSARPTVGKLAKVGLLTGCLVRGIFRRS